VRSKRTVSQPPPSAAETRVGRHKVKSVTAITSESSNHQITIESEIRAVEQAGVIALRAEWRRLFGSDPPRLSRDLLVRALAYRVQERAFGGLSRASLKRLRELTENSEGMGPPPAPAVSLRSGTKLVREWHGRAHVVVVADTGFDYAGASYKSLTQIAKQITGARWSGPRFFGLTTRPNTQERPNG
jgi:hypothetical protein